MPVVSLSGLEGFEGMTQRLDDLGPKGARKIAAKGVAVSTRVMVVALRKNTRRKTGKLAKSVKGYVRKRQAAADRKAGLLQKVVAPTATKTDKHGRKIRYGWILEAERPYIRPTFDATYAAAAAEGMEAMGKEIDVVWEREFAKTLSGQG